MDNSVIPTLEAAAEMLMAPPNLVTSEQRYQAESVFLEFRNSKNPYQLCREILEKSSYDYVLFETASLLKTALIREWNLLTEDDITSLREYLVNYLFGKEIPPFLKDKLLQTLAVIIKRGSISDSGRDRKALLDELEKIIISSPIGQQKLACSMIQAIMEEYAITVKSTDVGITWEVHYGLKKSFEATDLKRIFRFTVSVLEQIVRSGVRPEGDQAVLTKQLLNIVETILCWFHVSPLMSKRLIGDFESLYQSDGAPALRLNLRWKDTILKPELIALFFEIHVHVRMDPELATPSLICLVQLACLSGVILSGNNLKEQYYNNYVNNFIRMMSVIQPFPREMLGISNIYCKLVQFFTLPMIAASPPEFLQYLTTYTCHCIRGSIIEEGINDDTLWREALNKFIHTWSSLTPETNEPIVNVNVACIEIFNTYLQCRLAPPDGTRGVESSDGCNEDIKDDSQEDERQLHSNVLMTIGAIARKAPAHCFHVLFTLLNDRSKRLESQLQLMHMGKLSVDGGQQLITLFEDLHWILMITGHFVAYDCSEGDRATMPLELVQYSISENASVDASLRYFVGESSSTDNVDSILKIMGVIFRISLYEYAALEAGLGSGFSPELSATISWLLKIWASAYLMQQSPQHSEVLERAFGTGTQGSLWSISRITRRAAAVLRHLSSQPVAATHATQLLAILAHNQRKESPIASCEEFVSLVAWEAAGNNLPGHVRRELHRVFAIAASYSEGEVRARLLTSTVALNEKLQNILNMDSDTEPVRNMLADTIDCFIGVTDGVHEVGCVDEQFMMLLCALDKVPAIVFKYHNYQGVVSPAINLLLRSAKRLLHSVQLQNVNKFLEVCNTTFEVYRRWNSGKISSIPQDAEEEAYEDICAIMELVGAIARSGDTEVEPTTARGLRLVLPLVTPALLSMPTLALHAYRMLRDLEHHDQFTKLPVEDFAMVISALRVGLTAVSCDVSSPCCETITGIANKVRTLGADNPYAVSLLSLAELLLMLIIKMEIPPDTIPTAGMAIYALTCVKPALLEGLARQLIDVFAVNDPANVPRLEEAFAILTNGVLFDGLRTHKLRFQSNFDKFLTSVRGFLIVK